MKIDTSSPVMITGATGYVAGPIVKAFLEAGLKLHCPVRNPDDAGKLQYLKDIAAASTGSIKFFKANLLDEGSYLASMQGCTVVVHTASPFIASVDPEKVKELLLEPAVKGTKNVLGSVAKTPSVKRVVLTSSAYAMATDAADSSLAPGGVITEEIWNSTASETYNPYAYSKVLAEKEAWKIADVQDQYKLVVVNPAWIFGPGLKVHPSSESYAFLKNFGDGTFAGGAPKIGCWIADVRDVAEAHFAAAYTENAKGRYIVCGHNTNVFEFGQVLMKKYPEYPLPKSAPPKFIVWLLAPYIGLNRTQVWRGVNYESKVDNSKSKKDLKIKYHSMEKTYQDMFQQMIDAEMFPEPSLK